MICDKKYKNIKIDNCNKYIIQSFALRTLEDESFV